MNEEIITIIGHQDSWVAYLGNIRNKNAIGRSGATPNEAMEALQQELKRINRASIVIIN